MRIEQLNLKNFRCFKELDIKFPKSNLAVFIGLNGSGKTAILDAIAFLMSQWGNFDNERQYIQYSNDNIRISANKTINEIKVSHCDKVILWKIDKENGLNDVAIMKLDEAVVELFKSFFKFRVYDGGSINDGDFLFSYYKSNRSKKILQDSNDIENFSDFEAWFENEENIENELKLEKKDFNYTKSSLDFVRESLRLFMSYISGMSFSDLKVRRKFTPLATERSDINYSSSLVVTFNNKELKLSQLSEGQRFLLRLVGDIAFSLTILTFSYYSEDSKEYYDNVTKFSGIVLIDEIELHLHPQWQRDVLLALQKTFPNIQFIVTTHSPQVISNIKREEVFILEDNKLVEHTPYTQGRDSNSILYELFGVKERPLYFENKLSDFYTALEDDNIDLAKTILNELTQLFGEQDTEIVKANLHLSFAEEK